jgi:hypothetical protein
MKKILTACLQPTNTDGEYQYSEANAAEYGERYRITADDPSGWGGDVTNDTIIDDDELDRLAYEWRMDDETVAACRIRLLQDLEEI